MSEPGKLGMIDAEIAKTITLTGKDARDAARLFGLLADPAILGSALPGLFPPAVKSGTGVPDRQSLVSRARIVLNSRRIRNQYFHREIFGEPAWDILLALYISETSSARFTIGKLAEWVEAPLSTVVRWVKTLEEKSLVGRIDHPTDRRVALIRLREKGIEALEAYLGALPG